MGGIRVGGIIRERVVAIRAALAVLIVGALSTGALYLGAGKLFASSRVTELNAIASSAAAAVNGDLYRKVRESGSWENLDYRKAIEPLSKIKAANPQIKYIYTIYAKEGKPFFMLDPTAGGDIDKDGVDDKSYPNEEYEHATPELLEALAKHIGSVEAEPTTDKWGTFISAYAPFFDSKGRFEGVVGVDLAEDTNMSRRARFDMQFKLAMLLSIAFGLLTYFLVLRGVARLSQRECDLLEAQAELAQMNALLEQRVSERTLALQNAIQTKDTFLANMSHEMRTPLNGILGMSQLLLDTSLTPDQIDFAQSVHHSGEHLLELVSNILCAAQIKHFGITLDPKPTNINEEVERACELLKFAAHREGQEVLLDLDPKLNGTFLADALRLRQVVTNLVGNAVKFNAKGGVTYISTSVLDSGCWVLQVVDTGVGIPEKLLGTIFDEFTQVDSSSTRRHGGTGLGLTITKGLIELMGGQIDVESEVGNGTTFVVTLPLLKCASEEAA